MLALNSFGLRGARRLPGTMRRAVLCLCPTNALVVNTTPRNARFHTTNNTSTDGKNTNTNSNSNSNKQGTQKQGTTRPPFHILLPRMLVVFSAGFGTWCFSIYMLNDIHAVVAVHGYLGIIVTQALAFPATLFARIFLDDYTLRRTKEVWMGHAMIGWMKLVGAWKIEAKTSPTNTTLKSIDQLVAQGPCVVVCNHLSFCDNLLLTLLPQPKAYLTKTQYSAIAVFGWTQSLAKDITVDLSSPESRKESVKACVECLSSASVVVYPEGTRKKQPDDQTAQDNHLQQFKLGAFRIACDAKVPVLPVVVKNTHNGMGRWLDCGKARMEIVVCDPVSSDGVSPEELSNLVRSEMLKELRS